MMNDYSLNLSTNEEMESKIKMEFAYITNLKYSIKIYKIKMKRESI